MQAVAPKAVDSAEAFVPCLRAPQGHILWDTLDWFGPQFQPNQAPDSAAGSSSAASKDAPETEDAKQKRKKVTYTQKYKISDEILLQGCPHFALCFKWWG